MTHRRHLFVTGSDTGVGKTLVTALLAETALQLGHRVSVIKPVQTGCLPGEAGDVASVKAALGGDRPGLILNELVRFTPPVAPWVADTAQRVDRDALTVEILKQASHGNITLVEGAGGVRVPLGRKSNDDMRDLMTAIHGRSSLAGFPFGIVLVVRPDLGTINHTLLSLESLAYEGLLPDAVVVSGYPAQTDDVAIQTLPEVFAQYLPAELPIIWLPRFNGELAADWLTQSPDEARVRLQDLLA